ncbi:MAG: hypothetical protein ACF8XB_19960 [Planctomycetota bacterium JB042]
MLPFAACLALALAAEDSPTPTTRLDLRVEPLVTYYHLIRSAAASDEVELPAAFAPAVAAAKPLQTTLRRTLAWGPFDRQVVLCSTAAELRERFDSVREIRLTGGRTADVHADGGALAAAIEATYDTYLADLWPEHRRRLEAAVAEIEREFRPHEADCFRFMLESLDMQDPKQAIPTYLVVRAQWPEAYTVRHVEGGALCVVGIEAHRGTLLHETMLHEATHALDLATEGASLLETIRDRLLEGGMSPRDRRLRDVPHTIMFLQAGETIRRLVDPEHVHYGDAAGYYPKVERVVEVERPLWTEYLDGKIERDEAVDRIVEAVLAEEEQGEQREQGRARRGR